MYQQLSEKARDILSTAQKIAHEEQIEYVGTEHVLLAILDHPDCMAAEMLRRLGVELSVLRQEIANRDLGPAEESLVLGRLPGTPHFRSAVAAAIRAAGQVTGRRIDTELLLLGLANQLGSAAQHALARVGVTAKMIEEGLLTPPEATR
jgi:ATP-dependent Clp protease ATP-binding subunit ClpC